MVKRSHPTRRGLALALGACLLLGSAAGIGVLAEQPAAPPDTATPETAAAPSPVDQLLQGSYAYEAPQPAGDGIVPAAADTYIQKDNAGPMGSSGSLQVKNANSSGYNRRTLLRFDLSGHEEQLAAAERVELQLQVLYCDEDKYYGWDNPETDQTRLVRIYDIGPGWDESSVTWSTAPQVTDSTPLVLDDTELRNGDIEGEGKQIALDVTDYVKSAGKTQLDFMLGIFNNGSFKNGDNSGFAVASRENGSKTGPVLAIIYQTGVAETKLTVPQGEAPQLPATVAVTCSDGSTVQKAVTWADYDPALLQTPGTFTVAGAIEGSSLSAQAQVTVTAPLPAITGIEEFAPITALAGTRQDKLGLPAEAKVTLEDGTTLVLPVTEWSSTPAYDPAAVQEYAFVGTLDLAGAGVSNPEGLRPAVAVTLVHATDKNILTSALLEAQKAAAAGQVEGLVPSVRSEFEQAAAKANSVYEDEDADTAAVQEAYLALQQALWKLGYQQADKAALQAALDQAGGLDLAGYTEQSVQALRGAMDAARPLLDNEELSVADQGSVDAAAETVRTAIANLELAEQPKPEPDPEPDPGPKPGQGGSSSGGSSGSHTTVATATPTPSPAATTTGSNAIAQTSDTAAPVLWAVLAAVSAAAAGALVLLRRRSR